MRPQTTVGDRQRTVGENGVSCIKKKREKSRGLKRQRERERERDKETKRQRETERDRETQRQRDIETETWINRKNKDKQTLMKKKSKKERS